MTSIRTRYETCLKIPVSVENRSPLPNFERKAVMPGIYEKKVKGYLKKASDNHIFLHGSELSSADLREARSKSVTPQNNNANKEVGDSVKESVKSFLHFYESIPDYGDVNHLSDKEFYVKLQHLKEKQRRYLRNLDVNDFDELADNKNIRTEQTRMLDKYKTTDLNLQGKKIDINSKKQYHKSLYNNKVQKYAHCYESPSHWSNKPYISPSPTISASSFDPVSKNTEKVNPKPSIQINNYLLGSKQLDNKTAYDVSKNESHVVGADKENCLKTWINKKKTSGLHQDSRKVRCILNKPEDSCSSATVVDSISVDDYIPKPEILYDSESEPDEYLDMLISQSLPNSPALKQNKTVVWREPKITIPKPFNMTLR